MYQLRVGTNAGGMAAAVSCVFDSTADEAVRHRRPRPKGCPSWASLSIDLIEMVFGRRGNR